MSDEVATQNIFHNLTDTDIQVTCGSVNITAGQQTNPAGTTSFGINYFGQLVVTHSAKSPWVITESSLWIGEDIDFYLNQSGAPSPGKLTYKKEAFDQPATEVHYVINLSDHGIKFDYDTNSFTSASTSSQITVYGLAHTNVQKGDNSGTEETAWSGSEEGTTGWWKYFELTCSSIGTQGNRFGVRRGGR